MNSSNFFCKFMKFTDIAKNYKVFFFDCDGVLWHHGKAIPWAFDALNKLK